MLEPEHQHVWWHYFIIQGKRVWDNPYEPSPWDYTDHGYACFCGASPSEGVPR